MKMRAISLFFAVAVLAGCDDPPTADLDAAKQALDTARDADAERFAASEYSAAQRAYSEAETTTKTEDERFFLFKDFEQARAQIADAKSKATQAESAAHAEKKRQRESAEAAIAAAHDAITAAYTSLEEAPSGKGTEADIEELRVELSTADADLDAAEAAVDSEHFSDAESLAESADLKATEVADGVIVAVDRYHALVEEMRPWYERF